MTPDYSKMTAKEAATAIYTMGRTTWPPLLTTQGSPSPWTKFWTPLSHLVSGLNPTPTIQIQLTCWILRQKKDASI